jgi:hypothetical protein
MAEMQAALQLQVTLAEAALVDLLQPHCVGLSVELVAVEVLVAVAVEVVLALVHQVAQVLPAVVLVVLEHQIASQALLLHMVQVALVEQIPQPME